VANGQPPLGFVNPALYNLLAGSGYSSEFHDITSGSNGFSATAGYDLVTGIGSPNGQVLVDALAGTSAGTFTVTDSPKTLSVARGASGLSKITTAVSGGFNAAISLTASGQGTGVKVTFNPSTIAAPGSGHAGMQVRVAPTAKTGSRTITITAKGGGVTQTATLTLTIK
jgi:hypothetical protein